MEIRNAITTNRFPVTIIENHSLHRTTEYIVTLIINYNKFNIINGRMDTMTDIISVISSVKWAYCYTSCTQCVVKFFWENHVDHVQRREVLQALLVNHEKSTVLPVWSNKNQIKHI
uniref:Uncharacterized protein n=1 Tax=Sipha flava TaxID=143950 RepID=A0A2S2QMS6_9HEMI